MSNELETRYLVVTLPYVSGEEAESVAEQINGDVLTDGFTSLGTVEHALGAVLPEYVRVHVEPEYPNVGVPSTVAVGFGESDDFYYLVPADARALAGALLRAAGDAETVTSTCRHCDRTITLHNGAWLCLEAGWDDENDGIWRETCEDHDTFTAEHEPAAVEHEANPDGCPRCGKVHA